MALTLYYHPLSSYCWKALIALYEKGIVFEHRLTNLGVAEDKAELEAVWPIGKFPVIRDSDQGRDLPESSIIIEYLDHRYPGGASLIPGDWDAALDVRLWDRFFDSYVQGPMQKIVADRLKGTGLDLAPERSLLATAYGILESHLKSGTWVCSPGFTMAECSAAPALFYSTTLVQIPVGFTQLTQYFDRLMERPSVARVIGEARPFFQYFPFTEAIPQRFR
jgi:glutathione S-transferase